MLELLKYKYNQVEILHEIKDKNKLIENMKLIKMLNLYDEDKEIVTDMGNFVVDFPIGIRTGAILYKYVHEIVYDDFSDEKDELKNNINKIF